MLSVALYEEESGAIGRKRRKSGDYRRPFAGSRKLASGELAEGEALRSNILLRTRDRKAQFAQRPRQLAAWRSACRAASADGWSRRL